MTGTWYIRHNDFFDGWLVWRPVEPDAFNNGYDTINESGRRPRPRVWKTAEKALAYAKGHSGDNPCEIVPEADV